MAVGSVAPFDILGNHDIKYSALVSGVIGGSLAVFLADVYLVSRVALRIFAGGFLYAGIICAVSMLINRNINIPSSEPLLRVVACALPAILTGDLCLGLLQLASEALLEDVFSVILLVNLGHAIVRTIDP